MAFHGLGSSPTLHRFEVDGRRLYTWCVFDALFLSQVLGKVAELSTRCPVGGDGIEVRIAIDRLEYVRPAAIVMSIVAPDGRTDVIGLDVEEAMTLALRRNQLRYPDLEFPTSAGLP